MWDLNGTWAGWIGWIAGGAAGAALLLAAICAGCDCFRSRGDDRIVSKAGRTETQRKSRALRGQA